MVQQGRSSKIIGMTKDTAKVTTLLTWNAPLSPVRANSIRRVLATHARGEKADETKKKGFLGPK